MISWFFNSLKEHNDHIHLVLTQLPDMDFMQNSRYVSLFIPRASMKILGYVIRIFNSIRTEEHKVASYICAWEILSHVKKVHENTYNVKSLILEMIEA